MESKSFTQCQTTEQFVTPQRHLKNRGLTKGIPTKSVHTEEAASNGTKNSKGMPTKARGTNKVGIKRALVYGKSD